MPAYMIQIIYFVGVLLLIIGFKKLSSPLTTTAKIGLAWSSLGLLITVLVTYFNHEVQANYLLMTIAIVLGGVIALLSTRNKTLSDMPKMISLFNGMAGGAAASIAILELVKLTPMMDSVKYFAVFGALLGAISFSASIAGFFRLGGTLKNSNRFPMQQWLNALILVIAITFGIAIVLNGNQFELTSLVICLILALVFGASITLPVKDNDMPVAMSFFNVLTGLAISFAGFALSNTVMLIGGTLAAAAALTLTQKVSKSMNRSLTTVLFGDTEIEESQQNFDANNAIIKQLETNDAAMMMAFASKVIIIPGYGMATAQAQSELSDMHQQLKDNGVNVKFAVHPVAGRMPGHMNVLLAEANIPYEAIYDINEINDDFEKADVVFIIGANDVTNPSARSDQSSPIYRMPILNADHAKNIIIVKRGKGTGYSNIDNPLFYQDNTGIIYGDAKTVLNDVVRNLKAI